MSSSPQYVSSQPLPPGHGCQEGPRKSKFTFKHLNQLVGYSTTTPLRTIAHVDLDAFYAQCEMVRLGVPEDQPLAVQQWQGLIAINYPSRKFGMGRHITCTEAKKLCPNIILQHVATWKQGDARWAYHEDAYKNMGTHKVSLDPYRMESKKILAVIKETLPEAPLQRVEKAGIDEVFLELSAQIHSILLERYPELNGPPPYDDPTESMPWPGQCALDWGPDVLVDLESEADEAQDPDWDDICLCIGAEIIRDLRRIIKEKLKYTCSAGLARNKMLAKLGSGYTKPNGQTIIRSRAIQKFLNGFKFTKIRNLGGKLGDEAVAMFNTDAVKDLVELPLDQLQRLGDDTGSWLYSTIRGIDTSSVNPRTQIKSMLSAKSFRPAINTFEQGLEWLRIFAADIFSRCIEEGVLEHKRKPKSITLHHRQGGTNKSRHAGIPQGKTVTEEIIYDLAKNLLAQIVVDGHAWPCANLSLSVGGFEDMVSENMGIQGFLLRGEHAKALQPRMPEEMLSDSESDDEPEAKRRKTETDDGIRRFFTKQTPSTSRENSNAHENAVTAAPAESEEDSHDVFTCEKCGKKLPQEERTEHMDWHFAKELENEIRQETRVQPPAQNKPTVKKPAGRGRGRPATEQKVLVKGQQRLHFGNG